MKEYTKEFDGVTYTFTEGDLSEPFSYVLHKLKADIVDAKKLMGSRYTEDIDNKVQSLLDDFIDSSFECQLKIMRNTLESSKKANPKCAFSNAMGIGEYADRYIRGCQDMINRVADELRLIGVPICKQII